MSDRPDELEKLLSESQYLHDDGFTAKVISNLPPRRDPARFRTPILLASGALAGFLVVAVGPARDQLVEAANLLGTGTLSSSALTLTSLGVLATLLWTGVTASRA